MKTNDGKTLSANLFPVVGVGASAGGLDAFTKLLKAIPEDSGLAFVLVQHLDPNHESILTDILQKITPIPVLEISDDIKVEPNHIYIIPSNKMLVANDGVLELSPRPTNKKERNLPIDLFFTSLAEVHRSHAIGVVLSGTASDGTAGLKAIKEYGGLTFAQDEQSATYGGMPSSAKEAGVVDFILSPDQIPLKILEINKSGREVKDENISLQDEDAFKKILSQLRIRKGTDFSYYKQTTLRRRILRRMALNKTDSPGAYLEILLGNKAEQDVLYQDLLIPVTGFFRDTKSFDLLCSFLFPQIIKDKPAGEPIRVWVTACSTGEEAYSIAMCFTECMGANQRKVQIFATDISEPAIRKAREGLYKKSEVAGVSASRLKEFFTPTKDGYAVNKPLREMCVFAEHNFLKDPAFRKMDFISCRNVLIYMQPYLQKKALTTFHYALNGKGFLFLGRTETANSVKELFTAIRKDEKLYARNNVPVKYMHDAQPKGKRSISTPHNSVKVETMDNDFQRKADDVVLSKYNPPGVIVNEAMEIVNFRGNTSAYLEQLPGKPSHNLIKMAKPGLGFELRNLLHKVKKQNAQVSEKTIPFERNGTITYISIEAIPLSNTIEPYYLILFHDNQSIAEKLNPIGKQIKPNGKSQVSKNKEKLDARDIRIHQLEQELAQTHEDMRSITDDQEATNEELQSDNEELSSSSEELQSLNEELETSKEELQSSNEELLIVNQEMVSLNNQLKASRDYAEAIVATIREPLLVLDKELRIKTANRSFYETFQTSKPETEGKRIYDLDNKRWNIPSLCNALEKVLSEKESFFDLEVTIESFKSTVSRTMLLNAREMRGESMDETLLLLAVEDVTNLANTQKKLQVQADMVTELLLTTPAFVCTLRGPDHVYDLVNDRYQQIFGSRNLRGKPLMEALPELKEQGFDTLLDKVYSTGEKYVGIDIPITLSRDENQEPEIGYFNFSYQPMYDENKSIFSILVFGYEVTEQVLAKNKLLDFQQRYAKELEEKVLQRTQELSVANELLEIKNEELQLMNKELNSFTYVSSHDLQEPLRKIQTFAKRLLETENHNLSEKGKDYFIRVQKSAHRMQTLIEDLLAFSRISTRERKFENVDLNQIIGEVNAELKETIQEQNATIEIKELCSVYIIPFQFRQMMLNLLSNAIKFSKPDVPAHIIIESEIIIMSKTNDKDLIPGKEYCHISVKDNGIGFEPEYKERIFDLFQRLHGKVSYEGTGIGLSIVKKIVGIHNGRIFANSELNEGTTFDIYIPVEPIKVEQQSSKNI